MSNTPITDRAAFFADARLGKTVFVVLHKDAQELERMCAALAKALDYHRIQTRPIRTTTEALARWQAMKAQK